MYQSPFFTIKTFALLPNFIKVLFYQIKLIDIFNIHYLSITYLVLKVVFAVILFNFVFHWIIVLQKLQMLFISSKKLFSSWNYSNFFFFFTFQIQKEKWKRNNLWYHELVCTKYQALYYITKLGQVICH